MEELTQEHNSSSTSAVDVHAAGGLVYRDTSGKKIPEILLIHRPNRDWSFPKGKQDPGETLLQTAIREVKEETGLTCLAQDLVGQVNYVVSEKLNNLVFQLSSVFFINDSKLNLNLIFTTKVL